MDFCVEFLMIEQIKMDGPTAPRNETKFPTRRSSSFEDAFFARKISFILFRYFATFLIGKEHFLS